MRTTMDDSGRVIVPTAIREQLGLIAGPLENRVQGTAVVIEIETPDNVVEDHGRLVIAGGPVLTPDEVRTLRLADQR